MKCPDKQISAFSVIYNFVYHYLQTHFSTYCKSDKSKFHFWLGLIIVLIVFLLTNTRIEKDYSDTNKVSGLTTQ